MEDFANFVSYIALENYKKVEINFKPEYLTMKNKNGEIPIHSVCRNGNLNIFKFLTKDDGKLYVNELNNYNNTPLHLACQYGHYEVVKLLCEMECEINAGNSNGDRPIHLACRNGNLNIVSWLSKDCDINVPNNTDYCPIHYACQYGHYDIAKLLCEKNCNIESCNNDLNRPIHIACNNNKIEIVKLLCQYNCDIEAPNKENKLPINLAINNGDVLVQTNMRLERNLRKTNGINLDIVLKFDSPENKETFELIASATNFDENKIIGFGTFGNVYKYSDSKTNFKLAIKLINKSKNQITSLENQINEFKVKLINKRIIQYFGSTRNEEGMYIFMEYMEESLSELINRLKPLPRLRIKKYSQHILEAIKFLHHINVIHRDIKPRNILIDDKDNIKLCDFGVSCFLEPNSTTLEFCGTISYMAPEVYLKEMYGFPSDIWSFGATLVEMLSGNPPYADLPAIALVGKLMKKKKIKFKPLKQMSKDMSDMIDEMIFVYNQNERATAEDLLKFINDHDI